MTKRHLLASVAVTALLALAGCGGDDDESTTASTGTEATDTALSEEEFLSQANGICAAGNKELDRAGSELFGGGQPSAAEVEQFASDVLVPSIQGQIDGIRALPAPEELQGAVNTFLDDAETALGELEADPSLLASEEDDLFAEVNAQAEELGLTDCAG